MRPAPGDWIERLTSNLGDPRLAPIPHRHFLLRCPALGVLPVRMAWFDLLTTTLGGVRLAGDGVSRGWMRRQGPYLRVAFASRRRHGRVGTGNGVVSQVAQRVAGTGVKLQVQVVAPTISTVADVGNRIGIKQKVSDHGDNYNHNPIEEVIESKNNDHRELSVVASR